MHTLAPNRIASYSTFSISNVEQENIRLQEEITRLRQQLEWSYNMHAETQRNLIIAQGQPKAAGFDTTQFDHENVN